MRRSQLGEIDYLLFLIGIQPFYREFNRYHFAKITTDSHRFSQINFSVMWKNLYITIRFIPSLRSRVLKLISKPSVKPDNFK